LTRTAQWGVKEAGALSAFSESAKSLNESLVTSLEQAPPRFMNPPFNILLAEDERSVAFSISFALKADGHRVEIVSDGEQALADLIAKPAAFDILITDNSMPRMSGIELTKRLRETAFRGKIVVLSAHLSAETRAAYLELGVDLMVPKPFDVHELRASILRVGRGEQGRVEPARGRLSGLEAYRLLRLGLPEPEDLARSDKERAS
jgi:DNA-binding response OmpR family regulator